MNSHKYESNKTIEMQISELKNQIEIVKATPFFEFPKSTGIPGNDGFVGKQAEHLYDQPLETNLKKLIALKADIDERNMQLNNISQHLAEITPLILTSSKDNYCWAELEKIQKSLKKLKEMNLPKSNSDAQTQQQISSIEKQLKDGKVKIAKQRLERQIASMKAHREAKEDYIEAQKKSNKYWSSEETALLDKYKEKYKSIYNDAAKLIDKIIFFKNYINKDEPFGIKLFEIKENYKSELYALEQMLTDQIRNQHQAIKDQPEAIKNQLSIATQGYQAAQHDSLSGVRQRQEIYYQAEQQVLQKMLSEASDNYLTARTSSI